MFVGSWRGEIVVVVVVGTVVVGVVVVVEVVVVVAAPVVLGVDVTFESVVAAGAADVVVVEETALSTTHKITQNITTNFNPSSRSFMLTAMMSTKMQTQGNQK